LYLGINVYISVETPSGHGFPVYKSPDFRGIIISQENGTFGANSRKSGITVQSQRHKILINAGQPGFRLRKYGKS